MLEDDLDLGYLQALVPMTKLINKVAEPIVDRKHLVRKEPAVGLNSLSTYILLKDGTYYEILRKDAMRLTDEEISAYACIKFGLNVARDMEILRGGKFK